VDPSGWAYLGDEPRPSDIMFLVICLDPGIDNILDEETILRIESIEPAPSQPFTGKNKRNNGKYNGNGSGNHVIRNGKKPIIKKNIETLDDALKQRIIGNLNKLTEKSYDTILENVKERCTRLTDDAKDWLLSTIVTMAKRQYRFCETFLRFIMDLRGFDS